jgi:zinc protease
MRASAMLAVFALPAFAQFPTTPPAPAAIAPAQFPPFQTATLSNGVKLLVVSNRRLPVLSISLSFSAGGKYDPAGKAGTADMVAALLTKGAGKRDAEAVSATIEGVGGSITAAAGADFLGIDASALSENAALAFELLADAAIRPAFDEKEIEIYRTQALSSLQLEQSQPASIASRIFAAELYGKHPYGRRPDAASVKGLTKADLVAFQKARLRPTGALLVLAGDITLARAQQMAEAAFKGWTGSAPAPLAGAAAPPARTGTEIVLVHRAGSVQSNIVTGNLTWAAGDPRHYAAVLANRVLGGGSDARLFMILREQKGWTYGAYSTLTRQQGTGSFSANAEVRTDVTDSSLKELMTQFKRMGDQPIPAKEFEDAKSALVGRFPLQVETAAQVAGQVSNAQLLGLPSDYVQTYRQKLAAVTPAAAQTAAKAAIQPDRMLAVVVGDGSKLYDKLKAIAPVRVVSIDGTPLKPEDLVVKAAALDVAIDRLVPRTDSFVVMVQGNPFGFQRGKLEKSGSGWKYTEDTNLGPIMSQHTEVTFDGDLTPGRVTQTGQQQGQQAKIEVSYAGGRAKGSATTPAPTGPKTVQVDAELVKGMIDDNMVQVLLPTFRWAAGAKFAVSVFQSGKGEPSSLTLTVSGEESVTVPAGTFAAWKVDMTGGEAPVTFHVEKAAPHRLVKIAIVGAPIEMRLAK